MQARLETDAVWAGRRAARLAIVAAGVAGCVLCLGLAPARADEVAARDGVTVSGPAVDPRGVRRYELQCPHQPGVLPLSILVPDPLRAALRCVVFVLPVEPLEAREWGDPVQAVLDEDLHNRHGAACVFPTFAQLPWYADHPTDRQIRQESYVRQVLVPLVDGLFPSCAVASRRHLVGFSKSGYGAWSLLLRRPELFGRAAAWDMPCEQAAPDAFGMAPIYGTPENFARYQLSRLIESRRGALESDARLALLGYGNFRAHHVAMHERLDRLHIPHVYEDGPARRHEWASGWLPRAFEFAVCGDVAAQRAARGRPLVVLIGGFDSDPTLEQIRRVAPRGIGNSGLYQLAGDLRAASAITAYYNWNGTAAGRLSAPLAPDTRQLGLQIRDRLCGTGIERLVLVGNSWGGHTALQVARELSAAPDPVAIELLVLLDPSSTGRGPLALAPLPENVNAIVHYFTRNAFGWGPLDDRRVENIDLGRPEHGFVRPDGPAYGAALDFRAHVAAEWDERIHADIVRRIISTVAP